MRKWFPIFLVAAGLACWAATGLQAAHSDHGCFNCHVPHNAAPPAEWGGVPLMSTKVTSDGIPTYTLYSSPTFDLLGATITQPDGASKLCLGCHDGSYSHVSAEHSFGPDDLARSHPVSVVYDTALANAVPGGSLRDPATALSLLPGGGTVAEDLLDGNGKLQCTGCHDVHVSGIGYMLRPFQGLSINEDPNSENFERLTNEEIMCRVCHNK